MNLVDSSGWLEYFAGSANGEEFALAIRDSDALIVPTIVIYEVFKRIMAQRDEDAALGAIAWMTTGQVVELTQGIALTAALLSLEHKLPMADSIILATARVYEATVWTQDRHFEELAGVRYIAPGSGHLR